MKNQREFRRPQQKQETPNSANNKFNSDKSVEIRNKKEQKSNNSLTNNKKIENSKDNNKEKEKDYNNK